jgi:uncharacterized peroxidase-related enzyme
MPYINTIAPADADGDVHDMYARQQSAWGYVPNYAKVFSHRPEVMARWGRLLAEIRRPMDARRFELVTFAAAHALRNSACALAHGKKLTDFFDKDDVVGFVDSDSSEALTDAEKAMMRFARKVADDASRITAGDVGVLRRHGFTDAEIFDIVATAAGRAFFTKILDALGVEPDSRFMKIDADFRKPLTVGRPIDCRDVEQLPTFR